MKSIFRLAGFALLFTLGAMAAEDLPPAKVLEKAKALAQDGNHREAADLLQPLMAKTTAVDDRVRADVLGLLFDEFGQLGEESQQVGILEKAAADFPSSWKVLATAGERLIHRVNHNGWLLNGEFQRGYRRASGEWKSTVLRDRAQGLAWLVAAMKGGAKEDRIGVLKMISDSLIGGQQGARNAWQMGILTVLEHFPAYDDEEGGDEPASGYPVNEKGDPVYFGLPQSWDAATNDGERFMWIMAERKALGGAAALEALGEVAELGQHWFGVGSLQEWDGWSRMQEATDGSAARGSIAAVHTLKESETVALLATGPKRLTLPEQWNFLAIWRRLAMDEGAKPADRVEAWTRVADELQVRRQLPEAATALRAALALEDDRDEKDNLERRINQIAQSWARLEALPAQPAGREAELSLTFRNAKSISFVARRIDMAKLVEDSIAYLKTKPDQNTFDSDFAEVRNIGQRLIRDHSQKYLSPPVDAWEMDLEPLPNHWDKHLTMKTPLKDGGAYLIEGKVADGNTARCVLWIEDLVMLHYTTMDGGERQFVADAVTGAPVPDAKVTTFGYNREYKRGVLRGEPFYEWSFETDSGKTNKDGMASVKRRGQSYQWVTMARDERGRLAIEGFEYFWNNGGREVDEPRQTRVYAITDRPVYRPAQSVKWSAWLRMASYGSKLNPNPWVGKAYDVVITNPRGEKLFENKVVVDEYGAISGELALAEDAALGVYRIAISRKSADVYGNHSFRVEEYKKPEFEVKVEAPKEPVLLGDGFEVKIRADYYFGGAVKEGKVKYRVERNAHDDRWWPVGRWDWLFGAGYGWTGRTYDWYAGARAWCGCMPRWPWWYPQRSDPPELVADGTAAIGADGAVTVKIDTALTKELHGDEDHQYTITAEVTDASRRTIIGKGQVLAARRPFEVYVYPDQGWNMAGEEATIQLSARTLDGLPVTGAGLLRILRVQYVGGGVQEEVIDSIDLKLDEAGAANHKLKWARGGQYRLSFKVKDAAGHEVEGVSFVTVRGDGFNEGKDVRFDDLEVLVRHSEYAPGDEVELVINTNREGSTVALMLRASNGHYPEPVWLKIEGKSTEYKFKVNESDQPNFFVEAFTVSDAKVHHVVQQILVPPTKRIATVELTADKDTYLPRQRARLKMRVRDQAGQPFLGAVVLTGYDKALEYISDGSNQGDIRPFFWGWKRNHSTALNDSLRAMEVGMLRAGERSMEPLWTLENVSFSADGMLAKAPMAAPAPVMAMAGASTARFTKSDGTASIAESANAVSTRGEGDGQSVPVPMIRDNFADTAVWLANVPTDPNGEAEISVNLPDNLTTWKLRAWVMGPQTQVGEASVEVITRKNVLVRLQAPRFFVEKDEVVLSANVHNDLDGEQSVRGLLELEGGTVELMGESAEQTKKIAAHGETRFDWRVKVVKAGEAKIRVKALAQDDADAMEMTFPVLVHGIQKTDTWSMAVRPDGESAKISITVPEERRPETTRLEVRYTPTLALALIDALPFLADYPYGCTEQTLNRFVPSVVTLRVLQDLGVKLDEVVARLKARGPQGPDKVGFEKRLNFITEAGVLKMARAGLARLEAMRGRDGGWGWFPGGRDSSVHITAQVVHGLMLARGRMKGLDDDAMRRLIDPALQWLAAHEADQLRRMTLPQNDPNYLSAPGNEDALVHCVLVEGGNGDAAMRARLYEDRKGLSRYNLSLLGLACHSLKETERRDMLLRNVRQFLKQDDENQTAWLDLPGASWWYWFDDDIETQAVFLKLLSAVEPKGEDAARIAKYLVNNRRNGTYWNSTRDTAAVVEALAAYVKASGETDPDVKIQVLVDGEVRKDVRVTGENLLEFDSSLVIEGKALTTGDHQIELRKEGKGPVYGAASLTLFSLEDNIPAAGLEVKVQRKFYRLIEEKPETKVAGASGQVVAQTGFKYRREEIESDVEIQSGDLVEVELTVESKNDYEYLMIADAKPAGFEPVDVQSGWVWKGLSSYREFRDEAVVFFADRLPQGSHNLSYRVKAEVPGRFSALPTMIKAMYAPDLSGNSLEWKARIAESAP
jgi:uncharacterized protein YfaS (alpha-2-macroglobulin family)